MYIDHLTLHMVHAFSTNLFRLENATSNHEVLQMLQRGNETACNRVARVRLILMQVPVCYYW